MQKKLVLLYSVTYSIILCSYCNNSGNHHHAPTTQLYYKRERTGDAVTPGTGGSVSPLSPTDEPSAPLSPIFASVCCACAPLGYLVSSRPTHELMNSVKDVGKRAFITRVGLTIAGSTVIARRSRTASTMASATSRTVSDGTKGCLKPSKSLVAMCRAH